MRDAAAFFIIKIQKLMLQFQDFFHENVDAMNKRQLEFAQLDKHSESTFNKLSYNLDTRPGSCSWKENWQLSQQGAKERKREQC